MTRTILRRAGQWLLADRYRLALLGVLVLYVVVFVGMAFDLHAGMRTHRSDLGQIDQAVWNSSRGRFVEQTDNGFVATRLTDHVEPILVLVSPVFWLWDDVRALLLLQTVFVALGALPLYSLARRQFVKLLTPAEQRQIWHYEPVQQLTRPLAFTLALAYLLAPQLHSALLTEFHAAPLAVPLLLWAFWAVDQARWGQFFAAALLVALVKEEMALLAAGLGAWAIWRGWWDGRAVAEPTARKRQRQQASLAGGGILVAALAWFYIATFVIVPAHAVTVYGVAESTYFQRYGALGNSPADIMRSFFTQPQVVWQVASEPARVAYLLGLFAAFAWLPLLGIEIVLLALPLLLANLLSAYPAQYYGEFHYSAPLMPYFAVAAAYGLGRLWRGLARRLNRESASFQHLPAAGAGAMTALALVQNSRTALRPLVSMALVLWMLAWSGSSYLLHGRGPLGGRYDPVTITAHHRLLEQFVAQIPPDAAVTATAAVHPHVSHRRYVYQFPLGLDAPVPAEWALLDVTTNTDMAPGDLKATVDAMLAAGWGVVDGANGFLLMQQGAPGREIPPAFYTFARGTAATPPAEPLRLLSIAADDWPRWRQTQLQATWAVGAGAATPQLDVVTPDLETVATLETAAPPALVWAPPATWQPGDVITATTLALHLPRTFAVRATGGDAPTAIFRRNASGALVRLPDDLAQQPDLGAALQAAVGPVRGVVSGVEMPDDSGRAVRAWLAERPVWPGDMVDVWLQWEGATWPEDLSAFVHLRRDGVTVAQADGPPRFFGDAAQASRAAATGHISDWRLLQIPADAPVEGAWEVVVGVYAPATGERLELKSGKLFLGNELQVGNLRMTAPPPPDQACAMIPATCASQ